MLKFLPKIRQRRLCRVRAQRATATEGTYVYNRQRKRLLGMQLTTNGGSIMETQKLPGVGRWVSTYIAYIKWFPHATFLRRNHVLRRTNRAEVSNFRIFVRYFAHQWGGYLGFTAQRQSTPRNLYENDSQTYLLLENCCQAFAYDASTAFHIQFCLATKVKQLR